MNLRNKTAASRQKSKQLFNYETLESRQLLASWSAAWVGQVGADYVGPWSDLKPSTIQDIELNLSGLPAGRSITHAVVEGHGADRWEFGGPAGSWLVDVDRLAGSTSANLFIEPARQESGREFSVTLTFDDGSSDQVYFQGGYADPNLRVAGQGVQASWLGAYAGVDLTQPSAAIGPDGVTDLQIQVTQLDSLKTVQAIDLVDSNNNWVASYGLNPSRVGTMQLALDNSVAGQGVLTFSNPKSGIVGPLTVQVSYNDGSKDSTTCDVGSTTTSPVTLPAAPHFSASMADVQWLGQVVNDPNRPGWERVTVSNMFERGISAWQLNDPAGQTFLWTISGQGSPWTAIDDTRSLVATQDAAGNWTLEFDSRWDMAGRPLNLLAATDDGKFVRIDLTGGSVDLTKRAAMPAGTETIATPGSNLQDLVNSFGTVRLADGVYNLSQPLVLKQPVNLVGSPGAILQFSQAASDPGWTAAIKLAAGNTRLSGFQVRFSGPIHWLDNISYGPTVIGSPDNFDFTLGRVGAMPGIVIESLNIQGPRPNAANEEAPKLMRLIGDVSGQISNNTLYGGTVEVLGSTWSITGNRHTGTWPGSFVYDAFAAHETQGLTLANNIVAPGSDSGTVFRLLMVNGRSSNISVTNNQVIGLGVKVGDSPFILGINAHEVILTENYRVEYEGSLLGVDSTRRLVRVEQALADGYQPGDRLAILQGAGAGQSVTIQAVLNGTTLLLDHPLPAGVTVGDAVSINRGIANLNISGNLIDQTDRPQSLGMVLVGNLYGLTVANNTIKGGLRGFQVVAYPSEQPLQWGWTRNVVQNASISGNTLVDVLWFNQVTVSHSSFARANYDRLYLTASVTGNTFAWSDAFLRNQILQTPTDSNLLLPGLELGDFGVWDTKESQLTVTGNQISLPEGWLNRPAVWNENGVINGQVANGDLVILPPVQPIAAPTGLGIVRDSGISSTDGLTNDARIKLNAVTGLNYEYRVNGSSNWAPVTNPVGFQPTGLADGPVQVEVRAFDVSGKRGLSASLNFTLDTTAPATPTALAHPSYNTATWAGSASGDVVGQSLTLTNSSYTESLSLARGVTSATLTKWAAGSNRISLYATDAAGNQSATVSSTWSYVTSGTWGGQDGSDYASLANTLKPDGKQDVRLDFQGLPYGKTVTSIAVSAFSGGKWAWPLSTGGAWAAAWKPNANGLAGSFYFQTNRQETGRPFNVIVTFSDGSSTNFWMQGGQANPNLAVKVASLSSGTSSSSSLVITGASAPKKVVKVPVAPKPSKIGRTVVVQKSAASTSK